MLRRLPAIVLGGALVIAAFSTGADFLFFLLYLGLLVVGGSYLVTRFGLADLEAGYALDRLNGQVGEALRVTYTIRNAGRLPKLWLEAFNPSTLPVPLPAPPRWSSAPGIRSGCSRPGRWWGAGRA